MVEKATIEKLKRKGVTINGEGQPKETFGSLVDAFSSHQISERLGKKTKASFPDKPSEVGNDETEVIPINTKEKGAEEHENIPADEFVELVLGRAISNLGELDGRVGKRMKGFVGDLAGKLNGIDTGNVEEVNRIFYQAIKEESEKTEFGKFLNKNFQGWDGKFEDENVVNDKNAGENHRSKEVVQERAVAGAATGKANLEIKKMEAARKKISEADADPKEQVVAPVDLAESKVECPVTPDAFLKKIGSVYFVSKKDISDMKVLSYNPRTHLVKVQFGQKFIEHDPERDEEGNEVPTYSIGESEKIEDLPYEKFMGLIEDDYVTDENQLRERIAENSKSTRSRKFENVLAQYSNSSGDVLLVGKYNPGKSIGDHTRARGKFSVKVNGESVGKYTEEKLNALISEGGYEKKGNADVKHEKKLKQKKAGQSAAQKIEIVAHGLEETVQSVGEKEAGINDMREEFGKEGTEYVFSNEGREEKVLVDGFGHDSEGKWVIKLAFEDHEGGKNVHLATARQLLEEGMLKKASDNETKKGVEELEKIKAEHLGQMREEFGEEMKGKYILILNGRKIQIRIKEFAPSSSGSLGEIGFVMENGKKVHYIPANHVREELKLGNIQRDNVAEKDGNRKEGVAPANEKVIIGAEKPELEKMELNEKEKKILGLYRKYFRDFMQEMNEYDFENDPEYKGNTQNEIAAAKERIRDDFWSRRLPRTMRKDGLVPSDNIEKYIEEIKKIEK